MQIKYRFSVNSRSVYPIYKDDLSKEVARETDQYFFREDLSSSLRFVGADYYWFMSQTFETEFLLLIEKSNDGGATWANYFTGVFYKTDFTVNLDDKKIEVKIKVNDRYTKVLKELDTEYNLVKLNPALTPLAIQRRPLLQYYVPGDDVISSFITGNHWEQDAVVSTEDEGALTGTYKFGHSDTLYNINISSTEAVTPLGVIDDYVSNVEFINSATYTGKNIAYYIELGKYYEVLLQVIASSIDSSDVGSIWRDEANHLWILTYRESGTTYDALKFMPLYHSFGMPDVPSGESKILTHVKNAVHTGGLEYLQANNTSQLFIFHLFDYNTRQIQFYGYNTFASIAAAVGEIKFKPYVGTGIVTGYKTNTKIFSRVICDVTNYAGVTTSAIPADDIAGDNRNYTRVTPYTLPRVQIVNRTTTTPTEYGIAPNDEYYDVPDNLSTYYPIARSSWGVSSIWFDAYESAETLAEEVAGRKTYILKDGVHLADAIKALLAIIDATILHDKTPTYSKFLYDTVNPLTLSKFDLILTQKSNVLAGLYDSAAKKAIIKLSDITKMLYNCFQCYWFIDSINQFRIEHISWFKNGGSYTTSTPSIGVSLVSLLQRKNGKAWGFGTNAYSYDKESMPAKYMFSWMDEVSEEFEGFPIVINSKFVETGKTEDVSISNFTTDIDYMILNPENISSDGFALFGAVRGSNLFDINAVDNQINYDLNHLTGFTEAWGLTNTTGFITVSGSTLYTLGLHSFFSLCWYDANKTFISGTYFNNYGYNYTVEAPANASYIRVAVYKAYWSTLKIVVGSSLEAFTLPFIERQISAFQNVIMQNGLLSWTYLHPNFWLHDLPSRDVTINNDSEITVLGIKQAKKQKVKFPMLDDPDTNTLIETQIGNGTIEKLSINLQSRMIDVELKYDTE